MNPSCSKYQRMLVEFLYEELPEDKTAVVQRHLDTCEYCREEFEWCRRTLQTIDAATRNRPRGMPTAGLLQRLNRVIDSQPQYRRSRPASRFTLPGLALAASFLLGVVVAPFLYQWYSNSQADRQPGNSETRPVYGNVTGINSLGLSSGNGERSLKPWRMLHGSQNDQLPEIEEELDRLTEQATLGRRTSDRSTSGRGYRAGTVHSSTPEGF